MKASPEFEFPPAQQQAYKRARLLEWITIVYMLSVVALMYFVMGGSQAMRTAWLEDMLALVPPLVFLIASRIVDWPPNERFPFGYHRAASIAFLCAALALFVMGLSLLIDAVVKLVKAERPSIGGVQFFGQTIWLGWLMLAVLLYSAIPAMILGRMKLKPAKQLHDKVLHADAEMNKADWMTAVAAMVGILGVGIGWWWTDAAAAGIISLSILHDGFRNLRQVIFDLMDESPRVVDGTKFETLPRQVRERLLAMPWIEDAQVRFRDEGHVFFGEVFVVVRDGQASSQMLYEATRQCTSMDWRLHDLVLVPVPSLDKEPDDGADAEEKREGDE